MCVTAEVQAVDVILSSPYLLPQRIFGGQEGGQRPSKAPDAGPSGELQKGYYIFTCMSGREEPGGTCSLLLLNRKAKSKLTGSEEACRF